MSCKNLDRVVTKIQRGELVDVAALSGGEHGDVRRRGGEENFGPANFGRFGQMNFVDIYMKSLAHKYPQMANQVMGMKTLDKLALMKKLVPILPESTQNPQGNKQ